MWLAKFFLAAATATALLCTEAYAEKPKAKAKPAETVKLPPAPPRGSMSESQYDFHMANFTDCWKSSKTQQDRDTCVKKRDESMSWSAAQNEKGERVKTKGTNPVLEAEYDACWQKAKDKAAAEKCYTDYEAGLFKDLNCDTGCVALERKTRAGKYEFACSARSKNGCGCTFLEQTSTGWKERLDCMNAIGTKWLSNAECADAFAQSKCKGVADVRNKKEKDKALAANGSTSKDDAAKAGGEKTKASPGDKSSADGKPSLASSNGSVSGNASGTAAGPGANAKNGASNQAPATGATASQAKASSAPGTAGTPNPSGHLAAGNGSASGASTGAAPSGNGSGPASGTNKGLNSGTDQVRLGRVAGGGSEASANPPTAVAPSVPPSIEAPEPDPHGSQYKVAGDKMPDGALGGSGRASEDARRKQKTADSAMGEREGSVRVKDSCGPAVLALIVKEAPDSDEFRMDFEGRHNRVTRNELVAWLRGSGPDSGEEQEGTHDAIVDRNSRKAEKPDYADMNIDKIPQGKRGAAFMRRMKDKHGCTSDMEQIESNETMNTMLTATLNVGAGVAGGMATAQVQQAQAEGKDVHHVALKAMARAQIVSGGTQSSVGAAQTAMAITEMNLAGRHRRDAEELASAAGEETVVVADMEKYDKSKSNYNPGKDDDPANPLKGYRRMNLGSATYALSHGDQEDNTKRESVEGGMEIEAAADQKMALAKQAKQQGIQHLTQGIINLAAGGAQIAMGIILNGTADANKDTASTYQQPGFTPLVAGGPEGGVEGGSPPPVINPGIVGDSAQPAIAAEETGPDTGPAGAIPPPLFGGNGSPGTLKDTPPGVSGGTVGPGSTAGGGGGASGSNVGSGGGAGEGGGGEATGERAIGERTKFETPNGGAAFGAAGSNAKRTHDTGMDINGLLQFMAKKDEDRKPASDIVNFGKNGAANAALAKADRDDGILGPNSNLFMRVTTTTQGYYQKGELR